MTKEWKWIAKGLNLDISQDEMESIEPVLEGLDKAFQPLLQSLSPFAEPAFHFECDLEEKL